VISCLPEKVRIGFIGFNSEGRFTPSLSFDIVDGDDIVISTNQMLWVYVGVL
jgi:hypothetical protein